MVEMDLSILDTAKVNNMNPLDVGNVVAAAAAAANNNNNEEDHSSEVERFRNCVDQMVAKVDKLEQRVSEVSHFYSTSSKKKPKSCKGSSAAKDKDKEKLIVNMKKHQQDATKREAASAKRMQELMRQFATILHKIMQHKWAWPFMQPVDVEGLGLDDYYEVIDKPMDFSTIKNKMEGKDGTGYKNVREIYSDVRLVFTNAMTYNEERSDVHVMAKTLLDKFEEKWLQLLPKVTEEENKRKEEEAEAQLSMQLAREAANAKMARDISNELSELDMHLEELREMVVQKCRKLSVQEKRKLGSDIGELCTEDVQKVLDIIAKKDPSFQPKADDVLLDMDALSESTLWRLKVFVKEALNGVDRHHPCGMETNNKSSATKGGNENTKRKREICDALTKTNKKRSKKAPN